MTKKDNIKDIRDIVREYLTKHGYQGLCHYDSECPGCNMESLMECEEPYTDCKVGYQVPCDCENKDEHYFHIIIKKPDK